MATYAAVIGVIRLLHDNRILLLRRNARRRTSPNKWQTPSGFMKEGESAEEAVLREVKEETMLDGVITRSGKSFEILDQWGRWIIIPFLTSTKSDKVVLDVNEHSQFKWITIDEISNFDCVRGIDEDLKAVGLKD